MKYLNIAFLIGWCLLIFALSSEDAVTSTNTSNNFVINCSVAVENFFNIDIDADYIISNYFVYIRKSAHFFIFLILGMLVSNVTKDYKKKNIIFYAIFFCFLYAVSDELHQLFLNGRTAKVTDIFIDSCGAICGILIYYLINRKNFKKYDIV